MSQLRLGRKPDGTRHIVELEPAYARVQGHGGAALGQAHTTFVVHKQTRPAPIEDPLRGEALLKKPRQRTYRARP